jgi:hypothetical protein
MLLLVDDVHIFFYWETLRIAGLSRIFCPAFTASFSKLLFPFSFYLYESNITGQPVGLFYFILIDPWIQNVSYHPRSTPNGQRHYGSLETRRPVKSL